VSGRSAWLADKRSAPRQDTPPMGGSQPPRGIFFLLRDRGQPVFNRHVPAEPFARRISAPSVYSSQSQLRTVVTQKYCFVDIKRHNYTYQSNEHKSVTDLTAELRTTRSRICTNCRFSTARSINPQKSDQFRGLVRSILVKWVEVKRASI
jgi:hypothetical protein